MGKWNNNFDENYRRYIYSFFVHKSTRRLQGVEDFETQLCFSWLSSVVLLLDSRLRSYETNVYHQTWFDWRFWNIPGSSVGTGFAEVFFIGYDSQFKPLWLAVIIKCGQWTARIIRGHWDSTLGFFYVRCFFRRIFFRWPLIRRPKSRFFLTFF